MSIRRPERSWLLLANSHRARQAELHQTGSAASRCANCVALLLLLAHRRGRRPVVFNRLHRLWRRHRFGRWWYDEEHRSDRIWHQSRGRFFREKGMCRWRLIDADLNRARQKAVLGKGHQLAFDRQCEGTWRLTGQSLRGPYLGARWFGLELQGLWRCGRRSWLRPIEHQSRASGERITERGHRSGDDKSHARHGPAPSAKGRLAIGWPACDDTHRRRRSAEECGFVAESARHRQALAWWRPVVPAPMPLTSRSNSQLRE